MNTFCRVAPETLMQYQAHVKRLKDAVAEPADTDSARQTSSADAANAADVVNSVQIELVGEAAARSQANISAPPEPHRPVLQPAVPNSTRCATACTVECVEC